MQKKAKSDILYSAHTAHWYLKLRQAGNYSLEGNESFWCLISSRWQNGHSQKENQCRERRLFKHTMKNLSKGLQCHTVVIIFSSSSIHHLLTMPLSLSPSLFTSVGRWSQGSANDTSPLADLSHCRIKDQMMCEQCCAAISVSAMVFYSHATSYLMQLIHIFISNSPLTFHDIFMP